MNRKRRRQQRIAVPLDEDKQGLSAHFGEAPYFYLATIQYKTGLLISEAYHRNPFAREEKGKGIKVSEWLLEKGVGSVYSPKGFKGRGPGYVFSDAGVEVVAAGGKTLEDIQQSFGNGKI